MKKALYCIFLSFALSWVGGLSNTIVRDVNGGRMPAWCINEGILLGVLVTSNIHVPMEVSHHLWILGDIIPIPHISSMGIIIGAMASIGDIFIWASFCLWFIGSIGLIYVATNSLLKWVYDEGKREWAIFRKIVFRK